VTASFSPTSCPASFESLAEEPNETMRDFILLALLTGARRANLLAMHWREINLAESVWRIPRTKERHPANVTLCPEAVEILKARQAKRRERRVFVFPGTGASGHMVEPKKGVIRSWSGPASPTAATTRTA
jgi:integrase